MPRFDLNGNPMPDDGPAPAQAPTLGAPAGQRFDLAGNPIQGAPYAAPPQPSPGGGSYAGPAPTSPYAPPPGPGYAAPPAQPYYGGTGGQPFVVTDDAKKKQMIIVAAVSCAVAILGVWIFRGLNPPPVQKPDSYSPMTSVNNSFTVNVPDGWSSSTVGTADDDDESQIKMSGGSASIDVIQSTVAQQKANGLLFGSGLGDTVLTSSVTPIVFKGGWFHVATLFSGVAVRPVAGGDTAPDIPVTGTIAPGKAAIYHFGTDGFGEGESVTWTATGPKLGFPGKIEGYYAAMSGGTNTVVVICQGRQKDWDTLKDVFQDVVNSIQEGGRSKRGG
jgi:hypothetical protein